MTLHDRLRKELNGLSAKSNLRILRELPTAAAINLSSNDYLAVACDTLLQEEFYATTPPDDLCLGATSSRLLAGTHPAHTALESSLEQLYDRPTLTFSTGYQMNCGILPALSTPTTLIIADKLVHASIIDGIKLSKGRLLRFAHNDLCKLEEVVEKHHREYSEIIVVVESIYSMDGDCADLVRLVELKERYDNVLLYVDEAHAVGVRGGGGLGVAEELGVINRIDFLCGTFGKALGSIGGFVVCDEVAKQYLVNRMRTLIFTTALPPICAAWSNFVVNHLEEFRSRRKHLNTIATVLRSGLKDLGYEMPSSSHIVPIIEGSNERAVALSQRLQQGGFYALPLRPPTVPQGRARVRISLNSKVNLDDIERLLQWCKNS